MLMKIVSNSIFLWAMMSILSAKPRSWKDFVSMLFIEISTLMTILPKTCLRSQDKVSPLRSKVFSVSKTIFQNTWKVMHITLWLSQFKTVFVFRFSLKTHSHLKDFRHCLQHLLLNPFRLRRKSRFGLLQLTSYGPMTFL